MNRAWTPWWSSRVTAPGSSTRNIIVSVASSPASVPTSTRYSPSGGYHALELDTRSESFTVLLNADGARRLCSWRHTHDCAECGGHETAELSLDELRPRYTRFRLTRVAGVARPRADLASTVRLINHASTPSATTTAIAIVR